MNKNLIDFFLKAGKVKRMKQRGFVLRGVKEPTTIGSHAFRETLMGWTLVRTNNSGLDTSRIIKIILVHNLIAGYAGDLTPYEFKLKKGNGKNLEEIYKKWVRLSRKEKKRLYEQQLEAEQKAFKQLIKNLPKSLVVEMKNLWSEYKQGLTAEGRFVQQIDMLENFLQCLEYWEQDKNFPIESWWQQMKELISDPILVDLLEMLDQEFYQEKK